MKISHPLSFHRVLAVSVYFLCSGLLPAASIKPNQAAQAARGWLKKNPAPMEKSISKNTEAVKIFSDTNGEILYYIVPLQPSGFVILSADDEIEPIIAFSQTGYYDAAEGNPLKDLLKQDMICRLCFIKQKSHLNQVQAQTFANRCRVLKQKWNSLSLAGIQVEGDIQTQGISSLSDVRVSPLLQSKWDQGDADGSHCYNYYTPNNYPVGCVATAMVQVLRYHTWPTSGIGVIPFPIIVDGVESTYYTRGGDGAGGSYNWSSMIYDPQTTGATTAQRQAIGALCYDAGLSIHMNYTSSGSGAYSSSTNTALVSTFMYSNSIFGHGFSSSGDAGLWTMMNTNLDAALPVMLGINGPAGGHAVVADGYGYNSSAMYHHINMGWGGSTDSWYQLPTIDISDPFTAVTDCIYNIYPNGTGEIVSGQITSMAGAALEGVTVKAYLGSTQVKQTTTNSRGIYALKNLASSSSFRISAVKSGYAFTDQNVMTGLSADSGAVSGNKWGVNFTATNPMPPSVTDQTVDVSSLSNATIPLEALDDHLPNPPDQFHFIITSLPVHGTLSEPNVGSITSVPYFLDTEANSVQYTPCQYYGGQDSFTFKANDGGTSPTGGDSNTATVTLNVDNSLQSDFGLDGTSLTCTIIDDKYYASRSQVLYLSSELGSAKILTDLAFNFQGNKLPLTLNNWSIRMQQTDLTYYYDIGSCFMLTGWTLVYKANVTFTQTGWTNFHFQTPFYYNGTQNLLIEFCFDNLTEHSPETTSWYQFKNVGNINRYITIVAQSATHDDPLTWDFWDGGGGYWAGGWLPSIKLIGTVPIDPIVGDLDASCNVKLPDMAIFSSAWMTQSGQSDYNAACDISSPKDNIINLADLMVLANHWLQTYQP